MKDKPLLSSPVESADEPEHLGHQSDETIGHCHPPDPCPHNHLFDSVIDEWQGPVSALISCRCRTLKGLLWLQAWSGKRLEHRIYALNTLPFMSDTTFENSLRSTSCQLDRSRQELQHLVSISHSPSYAFADLSQGKWVPIAASPTLPPSFDDWRSGLSRQELWRGYLEGSVSTTEMS